MTFILYYTNTVLYCTVLYYTILYYTILPYTALYYTILYYTVLYYGTCGGAVVEALRYKPEGRGIDFRWRHWNFSLT
jgi:hypothetical protein